MTDLATATRGLLARYLALYAALFAAFGAASPFFPGLLASRGLSPNEIGVVLAGGTAIRLVAGPAGGRLADRAGARLVLFGLLAAASAVAVVYLPASGFRPLLLVSVLHASVLAPIVPIADALTLGQTRRRGPHFRYGWVRGVGSAAFILAATASGFAVSRFGLTVVVWLNAILLGTAALLTLSLPRPTAAPTQEIRTRVGGVSALLGLPWFGRLMLVAALVQGRHAMHDGFEVIRWQAAGIGPGLAGLLWSESVAAEVLVFIWCGQWLLDRLGAGGAAMLAAAAGVLRWGVMAQTAWVPAMALVEPLHGLTFALLHLACMRLMLGLVPAHLAATAQAFYGTVAVGAMTAALTLASGPLYQRFGATAFWLMAALCAGALPLARGLRRAEVARLA